MRRAKLEDTHLAFRVVGTGHEVVALIHSYTTTSRAWEPVIQRLGDRYTFLTLDLRGHGESSPPTRPVSIADLADDLASLLDALGIEKISFCGLSIGGLIGQVFALDHPERLNKLVLACTSARLDPEAGPIWDQRLADIRTNGLTAQVEPTLRRWFGGVYETMDRGVLAEVAAMIETTSLEGALALGEAVKAHDMLDRIGAITTPTLIIAGSDDRSFPLSHAYQMRDAIPGSDLIVIEGAGHQAALQCPDEFSAALDGFLSL